VRYLSSLSLNLINSTPPTLQAVTGLAMLMPLQDALQHVSVSLHFFFVSEESNIDTLQKTLSTTTLLRLQMRISILLPFAFINDDSGHSMTTMIFSFDLFLIY
jgi:hypothetical protein